MPLAEPLEIAPNDPFEFVHDLRLCDVDILADIPNNHVQDSEGAILPDS
jgi:hypothetical protein